MDGERGPRLQAPPASRPNRDRRVPVRALLRGAEYYTDRFRDGGVPVHRVTDYHMPSGVLSLLDGLVWVGDL